MAYNLHKQHTKPFICLKGKKALAKGQILTQDLDVGKTKINFTNAYLILFAPKKACFNAFGKLPLQTTHRAIKLFKRPLK